jgi:nitrilase
MSSSDSIRVLGVQIANADATTAAERDSNLAHACEFIRRRPGHDVYLLPEMSGVGYSDAVMASIPQLAEDAATGPSARAFGPLARELGAFIVFGFPRRDDDAAEGERPTISQTVMGPDGARVATYDKLHLCCFGDCAEGAVFRAGDHLTVFEVRGFKVALLICYDLRFPELWGLLAREHAVDVVLHPSCFPNDGSFASWHPFVKTRANENGLYVMSLSRAHAHFGHSIAVGPRPPAANAAAVLDTAEAVLPLLVERSELAAARAEYFRADRRADYAELSRSARA